MTDSDEEFLTIGVFARESGLTPSALRFYDDCGLLAPASIDAQSGYRYYTRAQSQRANIIRQLREDTKLAGDKYEDVAVEDYFTGLVQAHQKMAWLLRSHLEGDNV